MLLLTKDEPTVVTVLDTQNNFSVVAKLVNGKWVIQWFVIKSNGRMSHTNLCVVGGGVCT